MQTAVDALKSVMSNSTTNESNPVPEVFQKGWTPDENKGKEAQGGDDSRPPGKQHVMPGELPSNWRHRLSRGGRKVE
jgi:hypothetical protein